MKYFLICLIASLILSIQTQSGDLNSGYAIIKSDTIYGQIELNFDSGYITVKQDSVNRMFIDGIDRVTLLNDPRETYVPVSLGNGKTFYKLLFEGKYPLVTSAGIYFTIMDNKLHRITLEKDLYDLFGKRAVREYIFLRALDIQNQQDLVDVFQYFNENTVF